MNFRSSSLLATNLPAGLAEAAGARIVIVDNFSDEQERSRLRTMATERGWDLVERSSNDGFGEGVNAGVLRAAELGCRAFVILNPDAVASADVLAALGRYVMDEPRQLVSPVVLRPSGEAFFRGSMISLRSGRIRAGWADDGDPEWRNWISGACLAFSAEAFAALDGFAPEYFLYWEDVDLSVRAARAGVRLRVLEDLSVVHDEGGTHSVHAGMKSPLYFYYNTRNRLVFARRLVPRPDRARWVLHTPRESWRILLRGGRRQLVLQPRGALAALRGTAAGLLRLAVASAGDPKPTPQAQDEGPRR